MKFIQLFALLLCCSFSLQAQQLDTVEWCPPGATWTYKMITMIGQDYYQLEYIKDTVINNDSAKVMQASIINIFSSGNSGQIRSVDTIGHRYFMQRNDSIFIYYNNQFNFAYDFSPNIGDQWLIQGDSTTTCLYDTIPYLDTTEVLAFDTLQIGNTYYLVIEVDTSSYWSLDRYNVRILKNIGSLNSPFPQIVYDSCFGIDGAVGQITSLSCYYDDVRGYLWNAANSSNSYLGCHTLVTAVKSDEGLTKEKLEIRVFPNPSSGELYIETKEQLSRYALYDLSGRLIQQATLQQAVLDISTLENGLYLLQVYSTRGIETFKIIKQ